ncbi:MAG: histidinol-phosphate transaminase [Candidatus Caenarcaniphilales bacterium]|nr:histidinol-phosphate transaminase [Candidatus Caenarcaniphilales bacterium]
MTAFNHLSNLKEYTPGRTLAEIACSTGIPIDKLIKLNSNENAFGSSSSALKAIHDFLYTDHLNRYPEALGDELVVALKQAYPQIGTGEIVVGNGMDDIIEAVCRMTISPKDQALVHLPTFEYYALAARWQKAELIEVQTEAANGFQLNLSEVLSKITDKLKLIFLCSPNNPTGNLIPELSIKKILEKSAEYGTLVFLDEAYSDYAGINHLSLPQQYDNLIVGRTFSKLHGLAAMRIGWAVMSPGLLKDYRKVQTPFAVNKLALIAASASLKDTNFQHESIEQNTIQRDLLEGELSALGFKVFPSKANFIALQVGDRFENSALKLCLKLLEKGVIIRNVSVNDGAPPDLVRITVGTPNQNKKLLDIVKSLLTAGNALSISN